MAFVRRDIDFFSFFCFVKANQFGSLYVSFPLGPNEKQHDAVACARALPPRQNIICAILLPATGAMTQLGDMHSTSLGQVVVRVI